MSLGRVNLRVWGTDPAESGIDLAVDHMGLELRREAGADHSSMAVGTWGQILIRAEGEE